MSSSPSSEAAASSASISSGEQMLAEDTPSRGASPSEPSSGPVSASVHVPASFSNPPPSIPPQATNPDAKSRGLSHGASQGTLIPTGGPNHANMRPNPTTKIGDNTHHPHGLLGDVSNDGRIRNPVPSKLLDSASEKDGNFAVMHMHMRNPIMDARSMAAKRTSEMTQAAAMQATKNGYQGVKRNKLAWNSYTTPQQRQHASQSSQNPTYYGPPLSQLPPPPQAIPFSSPQALPPLAVKAEQARLLTFLRSIHPVIVVDQLCKALAYFGGIPGAPPPPNSMYPESDKMNGSGAFFIGWLSEIFPPADFTKPPFSTMPLPNPAGHINQPSPVTKPADAPNGEKHPSEPKTQEETQSQSEPPAISKTTAPEQDPNTPKRPRGRPKGSKGTKTRKDKGMKKGIRMPDGTPVAAHMSTSSVNESMENHGDSSQDPASAQFPNDLDHDLHKMSSQPTSTPVQGPGDTSMNETPASSTPSGKRRGRPKGSKNKPKPIRSTVHGSPVMSPTRKNTPSSMDRVVAVGWMPTEEATSHPRPSEYSSQREDGSGVAKPTEGLSQHPENWAQPPVPLQELSGPSGLSSQTGDNQSGKRKATGQVGEGGNPPIWTNGQGQLGVQQPRYGSESQATQNKRPRLAQDGTQPTMISPAETASGPTPTAPMAQDVATSSSSQSLGNYDLSPKVGRLPMQSAQPQYQQPQSSQQQIQEQGSPDMSFYRATKAPPHSLSSQQQQDIRERSNQARQAFYTQQQNQQRTQQYQQQLQTQAQYAQLKAASSMMESSQASNPSPGSSPTEPRRQNPSAPARMATASAYPTAYGNDSSFLTMEYAMSANRAVEQSQNTFGSQPTQPQLGTVLDEHERLFQAFNGRR